jgi:hypothetical protein
MLIRKRTSGLAMVLACGLALVVTGCGESSSLVGSDDGDDGGKVRFVLTSGSDASVGTSLAAPLDQADGPAATDKDRDHKYHHAYFDSARVTFSSVLARNLDGVLVNVEMELPVTVDVMTLEDRKGIALPEGNLPLGSYDQAVIVMTQFEGVTRNGTTITITPPGGGWTAIVHRCEFTVEEGAETTVSLKFVINRSFSWHDNRYHFKPFFVCASEDDSSSDNSTP